jgi:RNA polymerase sigma factor (sigma-70 family)
MASRPQRREPEDNGHAADPQRSAADTLRALAEAGRDARIPGPDEHHRLLEAAAQGDRSAQEQLCHAHLDLVVEQALKRVGEGLPPADLFQEGSIGLMAAINHFAGSPQTDFGAFARQQIGLYIEAAIAAEQAIERDEAMLMSAAQEYEGAEIAVGRDMGRKATPQELAIKLEWSVERTRQIGEMVEEARRRHDEELIQYLDPERVLFETADEEGPGGA